MAIDAIAAGAVLVGLGLYSRSKRRRRQASKVEDGKPTVIPKTPLTIAADCSSWEMPETWILQTAEKRFRSLLDEAMLATKGDVAAAKAQGWLDPVGLTYAILHEEIGECPEPLVHLPDGQTLSFRELQSDIPQHGDYYPHAAILGLFDTIYEGVEAALVVLEQTGDPARSLLFPV